MSERNDSKKYAIARKLRGSMTDAERKLWQALRQRQLDGHKFRRQQLIGNYVADFVCLEQKLIVEIDGGQHAEQVSSDATRTKWLEARGYRVLRFWNNEILGNMDGVLQAISDALAAI